MTSILELVEGLVRDPHAKADYSADPDAYLQRHGLGDLEDDDITEALGQAADSFPPALAAQVDPSAGLAPLADVDLDDLGLQDVNDFSGGPPLDDLTDGGPASALPVSELDGEGIGSDPTVDGAHGDGGPQGGDDGDPGGQASPGAHAGRGEGLGADVELDRADPVDARATGDGSSAGQGADPAPELRSIDDDGPTPAGGGAPIGVAAFDAPLSADRSDESGDLLDELDEMSAVDSLRPAHGIDHFDDIEGFDEAAGMHDGDDAEAPWRASTLDDSDPVVGFDESDPSDLDDL